VVAARDCRSDGANPTWQPSRDHELGAALFVSVGLALVVWRVRVLMWRPTYVRAG
jgi:hypothetical protein